MSEIALKEFDCTSEQVAINWGKWKRHFFSYLKIKKIDEPEDKLDQLLFHAGPDLAEIFDRLPETNETLQDCFSSALKRLDAHFLPQSLRRLERQHLLEVKQNSDSFSIFVMNLRQQAEKCEYKDQTDDIIVDHILRGCNSNKLKEKILQEDLTLSETIAYGKSLELSQQNSKLFNLPEKPSSVNVVQRDTTNIECFRCGKLGHYANDASCPARKVTCRNCSRMGHFASKCKTPKSNMKRKQSNSAQSHPQPQQKKFKAIRAIAETERSTDKNGNWSEIDDDEIFHVDGNRSLLFKVGNVDVRLIIDSGASANMMDELTFNRLKEKQAVITHEKSTIDKNFHAYASDKPLKIISSFEAEISTTGSNCKAKFYVAKDAKKSLLGLETAEKLGVIKIGYCVNNIQEQFPHFKNILVHIPVNEKVTPVIQGLRRIAIPLEKQVNDKLNELLNLGIIEPVNEPCVWISPMVAIRRESGDVRLCVDMRRVNQAIQREHHPLPTMDDILSKLTKSSLFSKLDIKNAFHQVMLHPDSRHLTTFITHKGLFRYTRLMFGLNCAPEKFQKIMDRILSGCEGVVVFIDDILIHGSNEKEHDLRCKKVLETLEEFNVLLNKEKCLFKVGELTFLGVHLSGKGIKPSEDKIQAIQNFRKPLASEEVRSFLGLVNYVSQFIPDVATISEPLRNLTKQDSKFTWGKEEEKAFNSLKSLISNSSYLGFYDVNDDTFVITDASPVGLGAVLIQKDKKNGIPRIIYFASKSLSPTEKKYCQTEREALAIVWAVERFKIYLLGKKFNILTDCKPLTYIFTAHSKPSARLERWILRLQAFDFSIIHESGKQNIADPLSRLSVGINSETYDVDNELYVQAVVEGSRPTAISIPEIQTASSEDAEIPLILEAIQEGNWIQCPVNYKAFQTELCAWQGIVLRGDRIVIPASLRERALQAAHEGHPGMTAMKRKIRAKIWWPLIDKDVEKFVSKCKECVLVSRPNPPEPMTRRDLPRNPWEHISLDFLGPLPSEDSLLVIKDYYSRFVEAHIMRSTTTKETIRRLAETFSRFGRPVSITADNGPQFASKEFKDFCKENNIRVNATIPYWPQENGLVENANSAILKRLKISKLQNGDWHKELYDYLLSYNSTAHSVTNKSPGELLQNRVLRDKLPQITQNLEDDGETRDRDKILKERGRVHENSARRAKESDIAVGDRVFEKIQQKENKLMPNFSPEEFVVKQKIGSEVIIEDPETGRTKRRCVVHLKKSPVYTEVQLEETGSEKTVPVPEKIQTEPKRVSGRNLDESSSEVDPLADSDSPILSEATIKTPTSTETGSTRSKRLTRKPAKHNDFIPI